MDCSTAVPVAPLSLLKEKKKACLISAFRGRDESTSPKTRQNARVAVGMIENPLSGFNKRQPGALVRECEAAGVIYRAAQTPEQIKQCVAELLERKLEILVVSGGDGTISSILGALHQAAPNGPRPLLALLRGGSTNMTHRELGLRGSPVRALQRILAAVEDGIPKELIQWRSPLGVRMEGETQEQFGFFFAVGAMQRVLRACQEISAKGALRGVVLDAFGLMLPFFRLLIGNPSGTHLLRPETIHWAEDEKESTPSPWQGGTRMFVYLTSLNRLIFGFDPRGRPSGLKLVGFKYPFRRRTLVSYLLSRGRPGRSETLDVEHHSADDYALSFIGQWVLDGEFYGDHHETTRVTVRTCEPIPFFAV